jgi:hypothetical protein
MSKGVKGGPQSRPAWRDRDPGRAGGEGDRLCACRRVRG